MIRLDLSRVVHLQVQPDYFEISTCVFNFVGVLSSTPVIIIMLLTLITNIAYLGGERELAP